MASGSFRYHSRMTNQPSRDPIPPELERYLALCRRIYERMEREGSWPWADSPNSEDLIDSEGNSSDV
jgi:hypothetical protein